MPPPPTLGLALSLLQAALYLSLPVLIGAATGQLLAILRKGEPFRSRLLVAASLLVPLMIALALPYRWVPLHISDRLLLSLLFGAGLLLRGHALGRGVEIRSLALLVGASVVALLLAEGAARFLPRPMLFPPKSHVSLLLPRKKEAPDFQKNIEPGLQANVLYPEHADHGPLPDLSECRPSDKVCILHLGDSMVWAIGLPRERTFPNILDAVMSTQSHINASAPGLGPDGYFVMAMNWLERIRPDLVVVHFFLGNDAHFGMPVYYCGDEPLIDDSGEELRLRCSEPLWSEEGKRVALKGPRLDVPYPVRILTEHSILARHIRGLVYRKDMESDRHHPGYDQDRGLELIERIITTISRRLDEHGIALAVSILPFRCSLEYAMLPEPRPDLRSHEEVVARSSPHCSHLAEKDQLRAHLHAICDRLDISCWDHTDAVLDALSGPRGEHVWLNAPSDDHHFSAYGHQVLADNLGPLIDAKAASCTLRRDGLRRDARD